MAYVFNKRTKRCKPEQVDSQASPAKRARAADTKSEGGTSSEEPQINQRVRAVWAEDGKVYGGFFTGTQVEAGRCNVVLRQQCERLGNGAEVSA